MVTFMEAGWFKTDDELDEIQAVFVNVLRAQAQAWPLDPNYTCIEYGILSMRLGKAVAVALTSN
jgi:hypothetical protein